MAADSGSLWILKPSLQTGVGPAASISRTHPPLGGLHKRAEKLDATPGRHSSLGRLTSGEAVSLHGWTRKGRGRAPSFAAGLWASVSLRPRRLPFPGL